MLLPQKRTGSLQWILAGVFIAVACILITTKARAQAQEPRSPRFEVASIKLNRSDSANSSAGWNAARISVTNTSLNDLVLHAYGIKGYQLSGGTGWIETARYDINAKAEDRATPEQLRVMLQNLLADRFKLAVHREDRDLPVLALVPGKDGPKLTKAEGSPQTSITKGRLTGQMSISSLVNALTRVLDRPVVDMTGITGRFNVVLEWDSDGDAALPTTHPSLYSAIQEQLGLKLVPQRASVAVFVIDHAERPSED